jgi:hypothetical protein
LLPPGKQEKKESIEALFPAKNERKNDEKEKEKRNLGQWFRMKIHSPRLKAWEQPLNVSMVKLQQLKVPIPVGVNVIDIVAIRNSWKRVGVKLEILLSTSNCSTSSLSRRNELEILQHKSREMSIFEEKIKKENGK